MNLGRGNTAHFYIDESTINEIVDKIYHSKPVITHPLRLEERVTGKSRIRSFKFEEDLDLFEISFPLDKYSFDCTNIDPFMRFINEKNHIDDRIPHMYYVFKYDFGPKDIRLVTKRIRDIEANLNILSRGKFHGYSGDK